MNYAPVSRATWYAEGLRWIGTVCNDAADRLERSNAPQALALEPTPPFKPVDEFLYDVRFRMQNSIY
jgi:hypothetical protein